MPRLIYLASARQNFTDILGYVTHESGSLTLGQAFVLRLRDKCRKLASLPGTLGQARPELGANIRSTPCGNYVIFFRYEEHAVEIINVLEGHLDVDRHFGR